MAGKRKPGQKKRKNLTLVHRVKLCDDYDAYFARYPRGTFLKAHVAVGDPRSSGYASVDYGKADELRRELATLRANCQRAGMSDKQMDRKIREAKYVVPHTPMEDALMDCYANNAHEASLSQQR